MRPLHDQEAPCASCRARAGTHHTHACTFFCPKCDVAIGKVHHELCPLAQRKSEPPLPPSGSEPHWGARNVAVTLNLAMLHHLAPDVVEWWAREYVRRLEAKP